MLGHTQCSLIILSEVVPKLRRLFDLAARCLANLPEGAWPPTSWYARRWDAGRVTGHDVFGLPRDASPIDMRWLVYRKPG